jgi:hypothetical protein
MFNVRRCTSGAERIMFVHKLDHSTTTIDCFSYCYFTDVQSYPIVAFEKLFKRLVVPLSGGPRSWEVGQNSPLNMPDGHKMGQSHRHTGFTDVTSWPTE